MNLKKLMHNEITFIVIGVFLIVTIVAYGLTKNSSKNYANIKEDSSEYLVYTKKVDQGSVYSKELPYVNIKGTIGDTINDDIVNYLKQYTNDQTNITYEYNVNGIILSLILKVEDHSISDQANVASFRSYNINLDTLELISNEALFEYFNTNEENIETIMSQKLEEYYYNLVNNNYIKENECDFDCFLSDRGMTNYMENAEYIVRKGNLILFEPTEFIPFYSNEQIKYSFKVAEG